MTSIANEELKIPEHVSVFIKRIVYTEDNLATVCRLKERGIYPQESAFYARAHEGATVIYEDTALFTDFFGYRTQADELRRNVRELNVEDALPIVENLRQNVLKDYKLETDSNGGGRSGHSVEFA